MEIALNELHNSVKNEELWFWGKIIGTEADYFVAIGINYKNHYEFAQKIFYYCTSTTYKFIPLPETSDTHLIDNQLYNNTFITGNPLLVLKQYEEETDPDAVNDNIDDNNNNKDIVNDDGLVDKKNQEENLDDSIEEVKPVEKKKNYTELVKVSYLIRAIDNDTNVVPQGSFKMISIHELRRNESFKGLNPKELKDLSKFHHFRCITDALKKTVVEADDAIFRYDFLDSLNNDIVKDSWSIQLDSTKKIVLLLH